MNLFKITYGNKANTRSSFQLLILGWIGITRRDDTVFTVLYLINWSGGNKQTNKKTSRKFVTFLINHIMAL